MKWPYDKSNLECTSTSFASILSQTTKPSRQRVNGQWVNFNYYRIEYSTIIGGITDPITITCSNWRNPIFPQNNGPYNIRTLDYDANEMDFSINYFLDTTNFAPYIVPESDVIYEVDATAQGNRV